MKKLFLRAAGGLLALAALTALPPGASASRYQESFDAALDPAKGLGGTLLQGSDETWSGGLEDGAYVLSNRGKPGAVRYYHFGFKEPAERLDTAVTVDLESAGQTAGGGQTAGAGLIYGYDPGNGTYYAFVVSEDGGYSLLQKSLKGLSRKAAGKNDAIRAGQPNDLEVKIADGMVSLLVNGTQVLGHGGKSLAYGRAGLIAFGEGTFRFDDFLLSND